MALSPAQQILSALHWLGPGAQYHTVADMHGLSTSTVAVNVSKFTKVVVEHLFPKLVTWPDIPDDVPMKFFQKAGFPCIAGCIDGTLINIDAPVVHEEAYVDRYGAHSINAMLVSGPDMSFYYVNARFPGSVNDARVLRASELYRRMEAG
jgi:DDE superfamily endonuclease